MKGSDPPFAARCWNDLTCFRLIMQGLLRVFVDHCAKFGNDDGVRMRLETFSKQPLGRPRAINRRRVEYRETCIKRCLDCTDFFCISDVWEAM